MGRIFCPAANYAWMHSHAQNPVASHLREELYRVYFSCRDAQNRSSVAFVDIDLREPTRVMRISDKPVLGPGPVGGFDDSGVSMGSLVQYGEQLRLYFLGWNLGVTVPWRNSIGLAVRPDEDSEFERVSPAPVLDRNYHDPYSLTYPWVLYEPDSWRMWYGSSLTWGPERSDITHVIKYAQSNDGVHWQASGKIMLALGDGEFALTRPCVLRDEPCYRMWFSSIGVSYRIGYAESPDGITWTRMDEKAGIESSETGWDSGSIEYASVFDHRSQRYMLYNGAEYGRTGFGIAILE